MYDLGAQAGFLSIRRSIVPVALVFCIASLASTPMSAQDASKMKPHPDGFWKIHPANHFKAEFGGEDVIGLANNQHIPTDCSIAWKTGPKFYCFSSQMSSQFVQEDPNAYLPRAAAFWAKVHPQAAATTVSTSLGAGPSRN